MSNSGRSFTKTARSFNSSKPRKRSASRSRHANKGSRRRSVNTHRSRARRSQPDMLGELLALMFNLLAFAVIVVDLTIALVAALTLDGGYAACAAVRSKRSLGLRNTSKIWTEIRQLRVMGRVFGLPPVARSLQELLALSPSGFEVATAGIFRQLGYRQIAVVGKAGDYCVDVCGFDPTGHSVVIQCKRYAPENKVGSREVQTFVGMAFVHHRAERGIFVTTSTFTSDAWKIADASRGRVELIDGQRLSHILAYDPRHPNLDTARTEDRRDASAPLDGGEG
jgi:Restriction endonuclease